MPIDNDRRRVFKQKGDLRQTMAFLKGRRQLGQRGLAVHHLMFDFSLTSAGFARAESVVVAPWPERAAFPVIEPI